MKDHGLTKQQLEEYKALVVDPCPWCPDQQPGASVHLGGNRDEPYVYIKMACPRCRVARTFHVGDSDMQKYYESRYSDNRNLILALYPRLIEGWNWKARMK